jgi:hypothetical protein
MAVFEKGRAGRASGKPRRHSPLARRDNDRAADATSETPPFERSLRSDDQTAPGCGTEMPPASLGSAAVARSTSDSIAEPVGAD